MRHFLLSFLLADLFMYSYETYSATAKNSILNSSTVMLYSEEQSGLVVKTLEPTTLSLEGIGHGQVLDMQPLLELHTRYKAARSEVDMVKTARDLTEKNRYRLHKLYQAEILADKELAQVESQWQSDQAKLVAAQHRVEDLGMEAEHTWGKVLTHLALEEEKSLLFRELVTHQKALVQAVIPSLYLTTIDKKKPVFVASNPERSNAYRSEWLSPSPYTDRLLQGETWFFSVPGEHFRSGMRVTVWFPLTSSEKKGVIIPSDAVLWYNGKLWLYKKIEAHTFKRVLLSHYQKYSAGYFVESDLIAGDKIVVTGAQMLLSKELQHHLPNEDDE